MDLQAAFRARLLANATIAGLVNSIAWGGVPQKTILPYVRLTKAAAGQEWTHDGPDGLVQPWVQIEMFGATVPQIAPLATAIQAEMQRLDEVTAGGWRFLPPAMISSEQWSEPEDLPGGGSAARISHDYQFYAQPEE